MIQQSLCSGHVIHNRKHPKVHRFKYNMSWFLLDLSLLDETFKSSKLWSRNRWNWVSLHDSDYIKHHKGSLEEKANKYFSKQLNREFAGQVFLFTHPRFLGYGFNSVSFYLAYENNQLIALASEINNTPWGEQHIYFHPIEKDETTFEFNKEFHISPFVDMDISYIWSFEISEKNFNVNMAVNRKTNNLLNVVLKTKQTKLQQKSLFAWSVKYPFQCLKMSLGIYWQALKIYLKKIPFINHPEKASENKT